MTMLSAQQWLDDYHPSKFNPTNTVTPERQRLCRSTVVEVMERYAAYVLKEELKEKPKARAKTA